MNLEEESTKGSLTLTNLRVPLKADFLVARAKQTVPEMHHFICIVYSGANVFVTNVLNTDKDLKNGFLDFEFGVRLPELNSDFSVIVHIYDLITMKTQIKKTPKKTPKKHKSTMKSPSVRSPGGPNAVLSTSFQLNGIFNINISNYYKKSFKLENFSFNSPLEGVINMKTELTVEHNYYKEGLLDVCDASGIRWNLRWVVLKGHQLGFWRFPEDVASKSALGSINLEEHLMSAENKEVSQEWAQHISRALNGIRIWNSDTVKPYRIEEFDELLIALD
ncbi:unnamed protein product [Medioppia subpectinata]|uniref:Anillin homology domain-containing protein n=1 Tax=Medioppia subpectinata TaxID=1979941 RepID=A0A7R9Q6X1_9ACAR|nr:unnamed protein product [Medioppia subpectinata]CAG2115257.1 unnamed protein product [Medioppia subpectinata]